MTDLERTLSTFTEGPEPSTEGRWWAVDMKDLLNAGYQYLEIHYPDDGHGVNGVRLTKEDGEFVS